MTEYATPVVYVWNPQYSPLVSVFRKTREVKKKQHWSTYF
jgi:hypothetical protein